MDNNFHRACPMYEDRTQKCTLCGRRVQYLRECTAKKYTRKLMEGKNND